MQRKYYTLVIFEDGQWSPQFGDYSKADVKSEADDCHFGYRAIRRKDMKIIETNTAQQAEINAAVAELNK
jgi:hypothetical protein